MQEQELAEYHRQSAANTHLVLMVRDLQIQLGQVMAERDEMAARLEEPAESDEAAEHVGDVG